MDKRFTIDISLQGPGGRQITYGRFCLGGDREQAHEIFSKLSGHPGKSGRLPLKIEFLEEVMGLPVPCGILHCSLEQLRENIALISKEIFRIAHLENKDIGPLI
ncbi:hypothetical protein ACTJKC_02540 [Pedobacter sp. 22226]|uniref:hypothetical protein n=1 Tax=Pedobacter sp. 22226 TaxID=3453894 RepID=UPI003F838765